MKTRTFIYPTLEGNKAAHRSMMMLGVRDYIFYHRVIELHVLHLLVGFVVFSKLLDAFYLASQVKENWPLYFRLNLILIVGLVVFLVSSLIVAFVERRTRVQNLFDLAAKVREPWRVHVNRDATIRSILMSNERFFRSVEDNALDSLVDTSQ